MFNNNPSATARYVPIVAETGNDSYVVVKVFGFEKFTDLTNERKVIYLFIYYIIVHEVQNTHIQRKIGLTKKT